MGLPKLESVTYDLTIPSNGETVQFRPFVVKEEKVLLTALESNDATQISRAMRDIVKTCTFNKVKVETLAMFDLEYIFLKLRAKSVGEVAEIGIKCSTKECGHMNNIQVNIDQIEIAGDPTLEENIQLTDTIGVTVKAPTVERTENLLKGSKINSEIDLVISLIIASIVSIYDADTVYPAIDSTPEELNEFVDSLNKEQFGKLQSFFENFPKLKKEIGFKCTECGKEQTQALEGLTDFFG